MVPDAAIDATRERKTKHFKQEASHTVLGMPQGVPNIPNVKCSMPQPAELFWRSDANLSIYARPFLLATPRLLAMPRLCVMPFRGRPDWRLLSIMALVRVV
jgi:hypothetical protein